TGVDPDGELLAKPAGQPQETPTAAPIVLLHDAGRGRAPAVGDRVLARISRHGDEAEGQIIRVLPRAPARIVGTLERFGERLGIRPIGARVRELEVQAAEVGAAQPGELVVAERIEARPLGPDRARVLERLGRPGDPRTFSLLAAHGQGLRIGFPPEIEGLTAPDLRPWSADGRTDLCDVPLVTIDGADARDFDDAVAAAPDDDPANPGGWQVVVAIADVAHYVRPDDPVDHEARQRGNSVYFPDRVLPMLPEVLSNDLCSLRPDAERACVAVRIRLDRRGRKLGHEFLRAVMRSRARLTYTQVQAAADGAPDAATAPLLEPVIRPLYGAFAVLLDARRRRGTLDLDLPETVVRLDGDGRPVAIERQDRLDSHRLIEEFMIAANVAAAETLEQAGWPCMYRVHDRPDPVKLEGLAQLLEQLGLGRGRGDLARPRDVARLLERLHGNELAPLISNLLLRAQSQAVYSPRNIGHYGLNLGRYAHFTSPIRRYADLLVHRALIRAKRLGDGGLPEASVDWHELGAWVSRCERVAMEAERGARSRFTAALLAERIGSAFDATVVSVQRFGLFVQLSETLADGLVPIGSLGAEFFAHDPGRHALIGQESGSVFALGDRVRVELVEVDALAGQLTFRLLEHSPGPAAKAAQRAWHDRSRRPARVRGRPQRRRV
ncbi:MAG TPA: VacB/RNase II family 3'-5' exoribonuclease, partial [Geminicoccaceae bacterium]|nr:VacB/RNase II family 3'-5' exoribonuclease [Geminicoccaceae bacterium]